MTIDRIAIIGLGLIGGSLGLALKQSRGDSLEIIGVARRPEVATEALRRGAVDRTEDEPGKASARADITIIATPVRVIAETFRQIAPSLSPGAIVSDVGSTKAKVMEWAGEHLPSEVSFIGGHPMTGKEIAGFEQAGADLFQGCIYCLTPSPDTDEQVIRSLEQMVAWAGARPFCVPADTHDELVAGISHLPLIISTALVSALSRDPSWPEMARLAASGYRDVTRLASGSPELHLGICSTNKEAITEWIDRYLSILREYRLMISGDDERLMNLFQDARETRQQWLEGEGNRFSK